LDFDPPAFGRAAAREAAAPVEEAHLVLLEEVDDAVVVLADDLVLAREHLRHVDRQSCHANAVLRESVPGVLVVLRGLEQRLRRNAADVRAGAAGSWLALGRRPVVDARGIEPELRRADRGDVAARPGTDDGYVKGFGHASGYKSRSIRAGSSNASLI